jgi:hypothetical protein
MATAARWRAGAAVSGAAAGASPSRDSRLGVENDARDDSGTSGRSRHGGAEAIGATIILHLRPVEWDSGVQRLRPSCSGDRAALVDVSSVALVY